MKKMIIVFILLMIGLAAAGILAGLSYVPVGDYKKANIKIGDNMFAAEVADTAIKKIKGLSGRESLGEKEGMLFVYDKPARPGFWMKGMKFSIDIIWMRGDKVVGTTENMTPESFWKGKVFYPPEEVDRILEMKAGRVKDLNIKKRDEVVSSM